MAVLRQGHRWLGAIAALFVIVLSVTGITLNHSSAWQLDRRYVSWSWLLDAYGIVAPEPTMAFADAEHIGVLLGQRLYMDGIEVAQAINDFAGLSRAGTMVVLAADRSLLLATPGGELVDRIDLSSRLPAPIERIGRSGDTVVISSRNMLFRSDAEISHVEPWDATGDEAISWSAPVVPSASLLAQLDELYRGRGLTWERLLADVHSGRVFRLAGVWFMDIIAACLVILSITGLVFWVRAVRSENGDGRAR